MTLKEYFAFRTSYSQILDTPFVKHLDSLFLTYIAWNLQDSFTKHSKPFAGHLVDLQSSSLKAQNIL